MNSFIDELKSKRYLSIKYLSENKDEFSKDEFIDIVEALMHCLEVSCDEDQTDEMEIKTFNRAARRIAKQYLKTEE